MSTIEASRKLRECAELAAGLEGRNPDGLPNGLTVSDDGRLLNWRGVNYVRQSDLPGTGGASHAGDSREKLEADVRDWLTRDLQGNPLYEAFAGSVEPGSMPEIRRWLDRQAAITERECMTAAGLAATEAPALQAKVDELTAEVERLQGVARTQAESFKGIEAELAKSDSACNTLRASVAGLKGTVERQRDELAAARRAALGVWRALDGLFLSDGAVTKALVDEWRRKLAGAGIEAS